MSTLPKQVQKQSEAVQELYKELNKDQEQAQDKSADVGVSVEENADSVEEQAVQSEPQEQVAAENQENETVEQRYKTLQGMYNAEVPRLHADKRDLSNRVSQLEQLLSTMQQQPEKIEKPISEEPAPKLVTDADVAEYGESIEVMRRVSKEETLVAQKKLEALEKQIESLQSNVIPRVEQVAASQVKTSEQAFWSELSTTVPDWRDTNGNQDFQNWLLEIDPLTGISRQTYLEDAQRNLDVGRVSNFFNAWKENNGGVSNAQSNRKAQSSAELERQVSPGKGKSTGKPQSNSSKTYSPNDIKSFFDDVRIGNYKGKEEERDRIERDIFAAQREGRIVTATT
jgi:hypothetical protein